MKKKILSLGAVIAICLGVCTFSVSQSNVELSTLALDNVEALASSGESGSDYATQYCKSCTSNSGYPGIVFYCDHGTGSCYTTACTTGSCGDVGSH